MVNRSVEDRFWAQIDKSSGLGPKGDCWEWTGRLYYGYGKLYSNGTRYQAHRLAWEIYYGDVPTLCVLHKCDNRRCCKKDHLFLGTLRDNVADMVAKNRQARGTMITSKQHCLRGSEHPAAVLTEDDVFNIRQMHMSGYASYSELAKNFNVDKSNIACIVNRKSWRFL